VEENKKEVANLIAAEGNLLVVRVIRSRPQMVHVPTVWGRENVCVCLRPSWEYS
jgi:hypothetical protein